MLMVIIRMMMMMGHECERGTLKGGSIVEERKGY
jgi:hypothetical protein